MKFSPGTVELSYKELCWAHKRIYSIDNMVGYWPSYLCTKSMYVVWKENIKCLLKLQHVCTVHGS